MTAEELVRHTGRRYPERAYALHPSHGLVDAFRHMVATAVPQSDPKRRSNARAPRRRKDGPSPSSY